MNNMQMLSLDEAREVVKQATPRSLQELKYKILFPSRDDIFTRTVLNRDSAPIGLLWVPGWLSSHDQITEALYPKTSLGRLVFPYGEKVKHPKAQPCEGILGDQTSKYHLESILEHTMMVVRRLSHHGRTSIILGLLHDVAKKYVTATNAAGELCFPNHAELSAYVAGLWLFYLPDFPIPNEDRWPLIVAIYYHMVIKEASTPQYHSVIEDVIKNRKTATPVDPLSRIKPELQEFFSGPDWSESVSKTLCFIEEINAADAGCTTMEELLRERSMFHSTKELLWAM